MILGIDVGGTAIKFAWMDAEGHILYRTSLPSFPSPSDTSVSRENYYETLTVPGNPILSCVIDGVNLCLASFPVDSWEGVGISAAGQIDTRLGKVIGTNGKLYGYENTAFKETLEKEFHRPVWVINDANAAALGEAFTGSAGNVQNALMITLGTGVGGGIILNGKIFEGALGLAGEIGHFTLYQDGIPCSCGKMGCFECYASTSALVARAKEALHTSSRYPDSLLSSLNGEIIFDKADSGDPLFKEVIDLWEEDIAAGISGLLHIFNPELVLIGGGVSQRKNLLINPLVDKIRKVTMPRYTESLSIRAAALGNDAGLIGAARYFLDRQAALRKEFSAANVLPPSNES